MANVDIDSFKPNSQKYRDEQEAKKTPRPINKVTRGKVTVKEKTFGTKMKEAFLGEEVKDVKSYVVKDVIVPKIKELIVDAFENSIEMIFGVSGRGSRSIKVGHVNERTSYNAYYKGASRTVAAQRIEREREKESDKPFEFSNLIFDSRGDAEQVLDRMIDYLEEYEQVSVNELYSLVGKTGNFTDCKYGWTSLAGASVRRERDGYSIIFPPVKPLD